MYPSFIHEHQCSRKYPKRSRTPLYLLLIFNLFISLLISHLMFNAKLSSVDLVKPSIAQELELKEEAKISGENPSASGFFFYDLPLPGWARGFQMPIKNTAIPKAENLLPGAPRSYRNGKHEGTDIFCPYGTPVQAAKGGFVLLSGSGYQEMPKAYRSKLLKISGRLVSTPSEILDLLYGRQVVIDHGVSDGRWVVTVYAHLSEAEKNLKPGSFVKQGEVIGHVGNSGTSQEGSKNESHLHFEIRVNGHYLGEGMNPKEAGLVLETLLKEKV